MTTKRDCTHGVHAFSALEPVIADLLEVKAEGVHEIDFSDVLVAENVISFLGSATRSLLQKYVPNPGVLDSRFADLIGAIDRQAYWEDEGGSLILTLDILGNRHFFRIPKELWDTKSVRWN